MSVIRSDWQSQIALEFAEQNDVEILIDNFGLYTRVIMRRPSTGKYALRTIMNNLLDTVLPTILFNSMLHDIIEYEKQA